MENVYTIRKTSRSAIAIYRNNHDENESPVIARFIWRCRITVDDKGEIHTFTGDGETQADAVMNAASAWSFHNDNYGEKNL